MILSILHILYNYLHTRYIQPRFMYVHASSTDEGVVWLRFAI